MDAFSNLSVCNQMGSWCISQNVSQNKLLTKWIQFQLVQRLWVLILYDYNTYGATLKFNAAVFGSRESRNRNRLWGLGEV